MTRTAIDRTRIIANRGLHDGRPRTANSIEAIERARDAGLGGVKLDVALVGGGAHLCAETSFAGEHLGSMTLAEARHLTGGVLPALEEVASRDWGMTVILELHQSAIVDVAADVLSRLPDNYIVASLDHHAVLRGAVEHQCAGMLMISHRPLPGTLHSPPHRLVRTIGWRSWPTWPDDMDAAAIAGWNSIAWNEALPDGAVHIAMGHAERAIADLRIGWEEAVDGAIR